MKIFEKITWTPARNFLYETRSLAKTDIFLHYQIRPLIRSVQGVLKSFRCLDIFQVLCESEKKSKNVQEFSLIFGELKVMHIVEIRRSNSLIQV